MIKNFKCAECGEEAVDGVGELTFERPGGQVTIQNIPAKVCPNGHQFFEGPTAAHVHRLARRLLEDLQSYSYDLTLSPATPDEIMITAVVHRNTVPAA